MRRAALLALALAAAPALQAEPAPRVLAEPAIATAKAAGAAMLAVTRAGARLVAVGERGIVLLSDDGGVRWRQAAAVPVQVSLTAVRFIDERTGWAVGHLGVILRTDDGGERWRRQLDGVAAAERVAAAASTSNDDRERQRAARFAAEGPDKPFFDVDFADAKHGIAVGAYGLAFATADGGTTWTPLTGRLPNPKGLHLYAVRWSAGQVYLAGEQGLLMKSADAGASFGTLDSPYKGSWFGLVAARSGTLLAYGLRGRVFRSADGGASWQAVHTGVPVSIGAGLELAPGTLALLGQGGDVLVSRDDGVAFHRQPALSPLPATGLAMSSDGHVLLSTLRGVRRQPAP